MVIKYIEVLLSLIVKLHILILIQRLHFRNSVKKKKLIRDKNDKSTKLTDNFKQNCRLTEISKTVRIITSS